MRALVQKLIGTGADLSTRRAMKNTLNYLGIKPENIDRLYVELKNSIHESTFRRISPKDKAIFLPQCLRDARNCKAVLGPDGWECKKCSSHGSCKIYNIKARAEPLGYRVYVVPGGSLMFRIVERIKPKAALGVACMKELVMAAEELKALGHSPSSRRRSPPAP
jgi:hypothetical protein